MFLQLLRYTSFTSTLRQSLLHCPYHHHNHLHSHKLKLRCKPRNHCRHGQRNCRHISQQEGSRHHQAVSVCRANKSSNSHARCTDPQKARGDDKKIRVVGVPWLLQKGCTLGKAAFSLVIITVSTLRRVPVRKLKGQKQQPPTKQEQRV